MRYRSASLALLIALCAIALGASPAQAVPPTVLDEGVIHLRSDSATAWAELDLHNKAANYHFEYGTADCASNPCAKTPEPEGVLKKSEGSIFVEASLEGLVPATAYHFRVVVTGEATTKGPDSTFVTYAPPQVFEPCPNEAFRSGELSPLDHPSAKLPDCRAYEQASPVDKNGGDAIGVRSLVHASPSGDAISFATATGFPGGEGSQEFPFYLSSRGADGWSTQGALPPQTLAKDARVIGWTPDFSQVFSNARILTGGVFDSALLSRSSADGSIDPVVPYGSGVGGVANFAYAGASADGSEVVFESKLALSGVPGAIAGKSNVYLWDRESGDLHLVDVSNSLQAPAEGAFAGPYDWINTGGAKAGGAASNYYTQDQHAITADGSVYFTEAGTGQLYLRQNPTQPQSAVVTSEGEEGCTEADKACTVHISATEKDNGTGPGHIDAAGPAPAAFVAATPDGSKAFFTSSEKLTNDANTGPEPSAPAIARAKIGATKGEEAKLSFLPTDASGVTVEGEFVYWVNTEAGTIGRAKLSSGAPSEIDTEYLSGAGVPEDVTVQGEFLYWTNNAGEEVPEDGKGGLGFVGRAKLGSAKAEEVKPQFIEGASDPRGIDVDSEHIYWVNAGAQAKSTPSIYGCLGRADIDGNPASVEQRLIDFASGDVVVSGSKIYFPVISSVNGFIRWANLDGTEVGYLSSNGTPIEVVGSHAASDLALDSSHIYWTNKGESQIGRSKLDGSEPEPEYIIGAGHPQGIALDSERIYWSANQGEVPPNLGNDLYRYDATEPAGDRLTDLTVDDADTNGAEVLGVLGTSDDGAYVYFVANGVLAAGATPGDCKGNATIFINFTGHCSLYLAHDGEPTRFIARLDAPEDATDWLPHGGLVNQVENTARVSADGLTVLFSSKEQLSAYDNEGVPELYRYRVGDPGPTCVSCNPTDLPPSGSPSFGSIYFPGQLQPTAAVFTHTRNLSADGNRVFFQTADPLVEADTNGNPAHAGEKGCPIVRWTFLIIPVCQDVYEWEAKGTGSCKTDEQGGGCLYLLSSGKDREGSFMADASRSGDDAFIITTSPGLVRQDQDQLYDFYDVRVGGGLASQNQPPKPPCEGESCPQPPPPAPEIRSPQTPRFQGPGNPSSRRCAKGRIARHGRCAKKARPRKQKHRRQRKRQSAASTRGRAAR